jgi:hypothetical protein
MDSYSSKSENLIPQNMVISYNFIGFDAPDEQHMSNINMNFGQLGQPISFSQSARCTDSIFPSAVQWIPIITTDREKYLVTFQKI